VCFTGDWAIVCHGDSWLNNLLFKCNPKTGEPERVIIVDFQMCRETCPAMDLAYFIYSGSGASSKLRQSIEAELLQTYFDTFMEVCNALNCEPLPGFSLGALKYRFYRMKVFGAALATILAPIMLLKSEDAKDLDKDTKSTDLGDMFKEVTDMVHNAGGKVFKLRMSDLATELYEIGVL